ncbi:MAG: ABC transporter substrate-binding protein [Thermomicrobiales bacterium]
MGISIAIATFLVAGAFAAFNMTDERHHTVISSPPPTLQPRASRQPTTSPQKTPQAFPGTGTDAASTNTTAPPPSLVRLGGDRLMGRAIAAPESTGGTLVVGVSDQPTSLNPLLAGPQPAESILNAIFEPLVEPHPDTLEPVGVLAESWSVDGRGTTWTFNLRAGVTWHDGLPLIAEDVVYSFNRYLDSDLGHPASSKLSGIIVDVEAESDLVVTVKTAEPHADLPVELGVLPIVAKHVLEDVPIGALATHGSSTGTSAEAVIGTGPFRFEGIAPDGEIMTRAFSGYWDGTPVLDAIVAKPVPNQAKMIELLRAGEIDVGTLSPGSVSAFDGLPVRMVDYALSGFTMLGFNLNPNSTPIFQDVRVRQALLHALDREAMVQDIRSGYGDVVAGTFPVNSWANPADGLSVSYAYDPARARELLDQAGWTTGQDGVRGWDGRKLSFRLITNSENPMRIEYLNQIREQWLAIGSTLNWSSNPLRTSKTGNRTGDFDVFLLGYDWDLSLDQSAIWACAGGRPAANFTGYCNPRVDDLLVRARRELDPDRRIALYREAQELVLADLPVAILDFPRGLSGVADRAHNVYPSSTNLYFNAETWWID